jgi:hypothetical protein
MTESSGLATPPWGVPRVLLLPPTGRAALREGGYSHWTIALIALASSATQARASMGLWKVRLAGARSGASAARQQASHEPSVCSSHAMIIGR